MGTFRSVLHSCGHRKVPTRHAPNPCHCSVRRRRPQPHPPTTPTRSPCPAPSTRPAPRVAACTGGRGSHPHHEHHLSGTAVPLHPSRPGPVTTPQNPPPPWRRGATNSRTAFAAARPSPTTNSTPPSVFTIPSRAPARRDCYPLNYKALILPTLLYGCESSFLREDLFKRLRSFHNRCARSICRVNQHHTFRHHTTSVSLFRHLGILDIDSYFHGHLR